MTDYTKLVKELREYWNDGTDDLRNRAADAIEELQSSVDGFEMNYNIQFIEHDGYGEVKFVPKWISVKERLPKNTNHPWDRVLVYTDEQRIMTLPVCKVGWGYVTHWMPLPTPPKEEQT